MRGFDDKALILFPTLEFYEEKSLRYRYEFQQSVKKLLAYLDSIGMEAHTFITDDLAWKLPDTKFRWVSTLNRGDLFFVTNNCGVPKSIMRADIIEFPDIVSGIAEKDELPGDISIEDRFSHILARDKKTITSIIPLYRVVVQFYKRKETRYRVVIKPNGGKIRLRIDLDSFKVTTYINDIEENPIDILGVDYGNKSLVNWRLPDESV